MISARTGDGVADLKRWFAAHVPTGPWLYPEDQMSDAPLRQLAAEITREKLYLRLHQELPYQSTVETEVWKELQRRLGADRADHLCRARKPAQNRARQRRPGDQGDRRRGAHRYRRARSSSRCTSSCTSKCAKAGATTRSAIAKWDWNSRRSSSRHCEPTGPARSGRPDDKLREAIQCSGSFWIASSLRSSQ